MATYSSSLRSGLPRVPGGEPWPPEGTIGEPLDPGASFEPEDSAEPLESPESESTDSESTDSGAEVDEPVETEQPAAAEQPAAVAQSAAVEQTEDEQSTAGAEAAGVPEDAEESDSGQESDSGEESDSVAEATSEVPLRRGLPRVEGGEPWPPEGLAPAGVKAPSSGAPTAAAATAGVGAAAGTAAVGTDAVTPTSEDEATAEAAAPVEAESAGPAAEPAAEAAGEPAVTGEVPLRRGLPRVAGGEPWPPEGFAPAGAKAASASAVSSTAPAAETSADAGATTGEEAPAADEAATEADTSSAAPAAAAAAGAAGAAAGAGAAAAAPGKRSSGELSDTPLRRGLPRVAGGDPWPPEGFAPASAGATSASVGTDSGTTDSVTTESAAPAAEADSTSASAPKASADTPAQADSETSSAAPAAAAGAGAAAVGAGAAGAAGAGSSSDEKSEPDETSESDEKPAATSAAPKATRSGLPKSTGPAQRKPMAKPAAKATDKPTAKPAAKPAAKPTAKPAAKASSAPAKKAPAASSSAKSTGPKKKEPTMIGSKSLGQWSKLGGAWIGGLIVAAGIIVLAARGLTTLPGVPEFLNRYPGEYHLPEFVDDGFPGWARWTHFLNIFFIVLIIRSGLQVRYQQKPPAFYTPKNGGKKVSINLWFHTGLDLLWMVNGVVFVVLLFVSDHWARIVPTSWEVFPNALSAMLQYMMLDWPAEDGWVNYNSLQQLMYFIVVFIAAPLAAITGVRMSEWWPKNTTKLNKFYPAPLARALHFPTMIFFIVFILIHVFLVLTTGMRQNLNHMYSGSDALNWVGFTWFVVSLAVIVGGWFAARPMLLAPIANMFGRVSSR